MSPAFHKFAGFHYRNPAGQRLGQHFVNLFISDPWPELFYAEDKEASALIDKWLKDNSYSETLPQPIQGRE